MVSFEWPYGVDARGRHDGPTNATYLIREVWRVNDQITGVAAKLTELRYRVGVPDLIAAASPRRRGGLASYESTPLGDCGDAGYTRAVSR